MTDKELMQQALEALEWNLPVIEDYGDREQLNRQHRAIIVLRERLAQPEQLKLSCGVDYDDGLLTVSVVRGCADGSMEVIYCEQIELPIKAQPEQELVVKWDASSPLVVHPHPAFQAAPPQRTWVGSGDIEDSNAYLAAELFVVAQQSPADDGFSNTITRIETWLKNHFSTPPQRKPLTDEEALELWNKHEKHWRFENNALAFTRAIEAAHGIKGEA